ncbi:hypothetical protein MKX53_13070 [Psychrobacillus sp. FSL K6-4615]
MNRVYVYLEHLSIDSSDEYDLKAYVDSYLSMIGVVLIMALRNSKD